jgi:hypothetical protein
MDSSAFSEITPLKVNRHFEGSFTRCLLHAGFLLGLLFNPED